MAPWLVWGSDDLLLLCLHQSRASLAMCLPQVFCSIVNRGIWTCGNKSSHLLNRWLRREGEDLTFKGLTFVLSSSCPWLGRLIWRHTTASCRHSTAVWDTQGNPPPQWPKETPWAKQGLQVKARLYQDVLLQEWHLDLYSQTLMGLTTTWVTSTFALWPASYHSVLHLVSCFRHFE